MFLIVNIVEAGSGDCKIRGRMFDANWRSQSINWAHVQNLPPSAKIPVSVVTGKWFMVEVGLTALFNKYDQKQLHYLPAIKYYVLANSS